MGDHFQKSPIRQKRGHNLLSRLVGDANESEIIIENRKTKALIDSGSMVTCISEEFYNTLDPVPELLNISDFGLEITSASGSKIPYKGYVEIEISVPCLGNFSYCIPALVVPQTNYSKQVPVIIGTNFIRICRESQSTRDADDHMHVPAEWKLAFNSMDDETPVRSSNKFSIQVAPNETKVIRGVVKNTKGIETALIEQTNTTLSGSLVVCPRVVPLTRGKHTVTVPVRVCNLSANTVHIPPKSLLCSIHGVNVVDAWTPESSQSGKKSKVPIEDLNIQIAEDNLTPEQVSKVRLFLSDWSHLFSDGPSDIGKTNLLKHEIRLTDNTPFKEPYRRIPPGMFQEVRQHIKEMLDVEAIRPSQSPYSSNIVLVRKKDGSLRFCIDYRKLNSKTIKDAYILPRIDDTIDRLAGSRYFSKLDLTSSYWQVELEEKDKEKTAFSVHGIGHFECNRMGFGLTNAPATFQRLMERCMGELNLRDCLVFLDDILIFSETFDEHLDRLTAVFKRLETHCLKLKAKKCEFFKRSVTYLGHVVSEEGVATDPEKTKAIATWPVPHNIKTLRTFLGFAGYYRRYVKDYSKIAKPLNDLLKGHSTNKGKSKSKVKPPPWKWGSDEEKAFHLLTEKLSSPPILAYADFDKSFILHTDASSQGLGAVLYQDHNGQKKVIAYASRGLKTSEKNYPAHKLEFLSLKWAVTEKFHDYLYGNSFSVITDNNPLTYILTSAKLDATGHRWLAALSNYNFSLRYRKGVNNADADGLSRRPQDSEVTSDIVQSICSCTLVDRSDCPYIENMFLPDEPITCMSVSTVVDVEAQTKTGTSHSECSNPDLDDCSFSKIDWIKEQSSDKTIKRVVELLLSDFLPTGSSLCKESPEVRKYLRESNKFSLQNGILYRNIVLNNQNVRQLVLPASFRDTAFRLLHTNLGHHGRDRTLHLMRERFYWPGLEQDVSERIKTCDRCVKFKTPEKNFAELVNIQTFQPLDLLCIDFLSLERSKGGYENILVITDHFTRYSQAFPTRNQTAKTTAKILFENFIVHYGFPSRLHSDQGKNFTGHVIKELCKIAGVQQSRTTPYHPMGNGMVERFNQTLIKMLGTLDNKQKEDWKSYVSTLVHAYNATKHDSTGFSPFFLMFGRHPRLSIDAYLGLDSYLSDKPSSRDNYARKLQKRLEFSYKVATRETEKNNARYKSHYDTKVRESTVSVGDRVLVRNVGLKGKHKLADKWARDPYVVVSQPNSDIPVFKVKKEHGGDKIKTLHRNMLLPISYIPSVKDTKQRVTKGTFVSNDKHVQSFQKPCSGTLPKETNRPSPQVIRPNPSVSSSENSDSESSECELYVIPQRRAKPGNGYLNPNATSFDVNFRNQSSIHGSNSSHFQNSSFVPEPSYNNDRSSLNQSVSNGSSSSTAHTPVPAPRRSARQVKPPDRYGHWVTQMTTSPVYYV